MDEKMIDQFEMDLLLESIYFRYGYDFREYAKESIERRFTQWMQLSGSQYLTDLIPKLLHDRQYFERLLDHLSVTVSNFFRDPKVFTQIRILLFPKLRSYSRINIWHVGCGTGEEVYSMAILLAEAKLLDRTQLYATDINPLALKKAKLGQYSIQHASEYSEQYFASGGQKRLTDYYQINRNCIEMNESLKAHICFAEHNLIQDSEFATMHLILCRNVLIYFSQALQNKALELIQRSLISRGFLVLGGQESLAFSSVESNFEIRDENLRIYQNKMN